jgi:hypothetical protein
MKAFMFLLSLLLSRIQYAVILLVHVWFYKLMMEPKSKPTLFQMTFLVWELLWGFGFTDSVLIKFAAYLVFPTFIYNQINTQYDSLKGYFESEGVTRILSIGTLNVEAIFFLILYAFILTYQKSKGQLQGKVVGLLQAEFLRVKENRSEWQANMETFFVLCADICSSKLKYLAYLSAIFTGFYTLSIPNSILIVWSFVLINRGLKSNVFSNEYFHYNVFLILLL